MGSLQQTRSGDRSKNSPASKGKRELAQARRFKASLGEKSGWLANSIHLYANGAPGKVYPEPRASTAELFKARLMVDLAEKGKLKLGSA